MIDESRVLYDCGPIGPSMLLHDLFNPLHLRNTLRLDHEIDGELLREAWERTKRVYPIIDAVLEFDVGDKTYYVEDRRRIMKHGETHMYLMKPTGGCNAPVRSKVPLVPNTEHTAGRLIAVTYHDDTIIAGAYHTLLDGVGFHKVFSTLVYSYLALYTGHEDEHPVVELREGRAPEEYYIASTPELTFSCEDFTPTPIYWLPLGCKGFWDDDMVYVEGVIHSGNMEIDATDFMRLCKSCGANPSAMIATLLARVAYALNPQQQQDMVLGFTTSARQVFGLEDSIADVFQDAVSYTTRDEIEHKSLSEAAQRIRADLGIQRTRDYVLTYKRVFNTYHEARNYVFRTVTYMGTFTIGDNDEHILELSMGTNGCANLYLQQVRDHFCMYLYHGEATQRYLDEFARQLGELGVRAQITQNAHLMQIDSAIPVL